jgi:hypothetical protein
VTKLSRKSYRGAVTGVFNTFQFIGSFLGGSLTGLLWGKHMSLAVIVLLIVSSAGLLISKNLELQTGVDESEIE